MSEIEKDAFIMFILGSDVGVVLVTLVWLALLQS